MRYVIPPDRRLHITDNEIAAVEFDEPRGHRAPIDLCFRSLAERHGDGFAVILTGAGSDHEVRSRQDRWYDVRLRPYRTVDNRIDGVVITFDAMRKLAEQQLPALLSTGEGQVHLSWDICPRNNSSMLRIVWKELHGPPTTSTPQAQGFGSTLIAKGIPNATVTCEFKPEGLLCVIDLPLTEPENAPDQ